MLKKIRDYLIEPRLKDINVNSNELVSVHRQILSEKKIIQDVFKEFYNSISFYDNKYLNKIQFKKIEIGSGSSFLKLYYPDVITSDIKKSELIDMVLDAQNMNLENETIGSFYAINCFHHFSEPEKFFKELDRVLVKGGGCIIIDPYYGPFASFFYKRVFDFEFFDKKQLGWNSNENLGPSMGANQALSYVIFNRDIKLFKEKFPNLEIVHCKKFNNYFRYLLSGGLNFKSLVPTFLSPILKIIEFLFIPLNHIFCLHYMLVLRKKEDLND